MQPTSSRSGTPSSTTAVFSTFAGSESSSTIATAIPRKARIRRPWYSDPSIQRDRSHLLASPEEVLLRPTSRFLLFVGRSVVHQINGEVAAPLYLTRQQVDHIFQSQGLVIPVQELLGTGETDTIDSTTTPMTEKPILAWVGNHNGTDYWTVRMEEAAGCKGILEVLLEQQPPQRLEQEDTAIQIIPLREFGDSLDADSIMGAGLLATAQGLMEFHSSHRFCSRCGARMILAKAGACCTCSSCRRVVYPRLDVASIMLITHASTKTGKEYCLLGRKAMWPAGRYSTLAGFAEVGETLEDCCVREVWEESGIRVDPATVQFVASQPWPFPQSLMVGFHAEAIMTSSTEDGTLLLPPITVDNDEMEDIQWFSKDFVRERLDGGSTALTYEPNGKERDFHIPGRASLARLLITEWALDGKDDNADDDDYGCSGNKQPS